MRIVHTSDWHLGQKLDWFDRTEEHQHFLDWLLDLIAHERVDALIVSGDIFDTSSPSSRAQKLLYDFLTTLSSRMPHVRVVLTAGNHDSGHRLEAPSPLLKIVNVHVRGLVPRTAEGYDYDALAVPLKGADGVEVLCLAVPFLRYGDLPIDTESMSGEESFLEGLAQHFSSETRPLICMAHLYAKGSVLSANNPSERRVGGLNGVRSIAFPDSYAYVALGHLHKAQRVYGRDTVRYAGSPIPLSFSEVKYRHAVNIIDITQHGVVSVSSVQIPRLIELISIVGTPQEVESRLSELPNGKVDSASPIASITFRNALASSAQLKSDLARWIQGKQIRLGPVKLQIDAEEGHSEESDSDGGMQTLHALDPLRIANRVYKLRHGGQSMSEELVELMREAIEKADNEDSGS